LLESRTPSSHGLAQIARFTRAGGRPALELTGVPEQVTATEFPKGLCVLLVEDNPQVRAFAEDLLRDLGCDVMSAADGVEALLLLDTQPVDLVFSDVVMPGISGVELARKIREVKADVPVLLATGYSDEIVRSGAEFAVMPKPYRPQELADAIVTLLKRHRERAA
jgi:CheY-like chemotaxis protein